MTDTTPPEGDSKQSTAEPTEGPVPPTLGVSISRNGILLGLFALLSTAIIAATYLGTADKITEQKRQARLKALYQVVPRDQHDNDMLTDSIEINSAELGHRKTGSILLATYHGAPLALIYPVTAREGYSGDIDIIVGVNIKDSSVAGVRVLNHKETPGLGDKVDVRKSSWVLNFEGHSLGHPDIEGWAVKKDGGIFDGFTGATITPRAVVSSVASVLKYHHQNVSEILKRIDANRAK